MWGHAAPGVTVVVPPWYRDGCIIAVFSPERLRPGFGIPREEPRIVGLATAFPANLREGHGAESPPLFFRNVSLQCLRK